jgi:hypothetical protein
MDGDAFNDGLDNLALFLAWERRPAGIEVLGFADDLFLGEEADSHRVDLSLGARDNIPELF